MSGARKGKAYMQREFNAKQSIITPEAVFIIGTYDENGVPNAMNAAWGYAE